jgi:membrane peptidoglycan carboxypeptidase
MSARCSSIGGNRISGGAGTITQQLARNCSDGEMAVEQQNRQRSLRRKLIEQFAVSSTSGPKDEIQAV